MSKQTTRRPKRLPEDLSDVRIDDLIRLIFRTQERIERETGGQLHVTFQLVPKQGTASPTTTVDGVKP